MTLSPLSAFAVENAARGPGTACSTCDSSRADHGNRGTPHRGHPRAAKMAPRLEPLEVAGS